MVKIAHHRGGLALGTLGWAAWADLHMGWAWGICMLARMAAEVIMTEGIHASMTEWLKSD